jgi:hypothetical protein
MQCSGLLLTFAACLIVSTLDTVTGDIKCYDGMKTKPEDGEEKDTTTTKEGCKACVKGTGSPKADSKTTITQSACLDKPCAEFAKILEGYKQMFTYKEEPTCCEDKDLCNGGNGMSTAVSGSLLVALTVLAITVQAFISTY